MSHKIYGFSIHIPVLQCYSEGNDGRLAGLKPVESCEVLFQVPVLYFYALQLFDSPWFVYHLDSVEVRRCLEIRFYTVDDGC